ncbi:hypothetical protein NC653_026794 [Populus alba x Populus x berolinensis]|uniref:Uncharacterized protein n=1 Tax=Populus alba x Populus x berolinensis TaxID=444605 RepID=A0AAD6M468_9ROSI|nr:hypothetical protein NC653_026794 [Populus alba x Populus x berolinensis]
MEEESSAELGGECGGGEMINAICVGPMEFEIERKEGDVGGVGSEE